MYPQRKYNRISGCNYSSDGAYFVTICTMNRKHLFGKIANGAMYLNNFGKIARQYWDEIPNHFDRVIIDEYCIMPNHLHGIIIVGHNDRCADNGNLQRNNYLQRNNHGCSLQLRNMELIPKIISQYKSSVTRIIKKNINENITIWQRSFYDHIIRNEKDMFRIQEYIFNNPLQWEMDEYYCME